MTGLYDDVPFSELPSAVPWVTFLPEADFDAFVTELVDVAQGAAALGNLAPVAVCLTQWRHSAEVYADPVLLDILTRETEGDLGPVPPPPGRRRRPRRGESPGKNAGTGHPKATD